MTGEDTRRLLLYDANRRSVAVAYLLLLLGGLLGAHRFHLGRWGTGLLMLSITLLSLPFALLLGWLGLFGTLAWVALDALRLPGLVRRANNRLIDKLA